VFLGTSPSSNSGRLSAPFLEKRAKERNHDRHAETAGSGPSSLRYRPLYSSLGIAAWEKYLMDTATKRGGPYTFWKSRCFSRDIYPGRGYVGGLGSFKDVMHGYWIFGHLAPVAIYAKSFFVPTVTPESCTSQITDSGDCSDRTCSSFSPGQASLGFLNGIFQGFGSVKLSDVHGKCLERPSMQPDPHAQGILPRGRRGQTVSGMAHQASDQGRRESRVPRSEMASSCGLHLSP
jgi:hypothetical protein